MRFRSVGKSVLIGAAVVACLLASHGALGVVAVSSRELAYISGWPDATSPDSRFYWGAAGPDLGSFQASFADSAAKDGAWVSASAFQDFTLAVDVGAGTINGRFIGGASGAATGSPAGYLTDYGADSHMELVFSVPEGQQAAYNLKGVLQVWDGGRAASAWVSLTDWNPERGEGGDKTFASAGSSGPFDLSGILLPGSYWLTATARMSDRVGFPEASGGGANLSLDFSIVPEPASVLLLLVSLIGRSVVRSKR